MYTYTQIQTKGLITIPINIRKELSMEKNDLLRIKAEDGKIIIEPVRVLPYPTRKYSAQEVSEFLALDKNEI